MLKLDIAIKVLVLVIIIKQIQFFRHIIYTIHARNIYIHIYILYRNEFVITRDINNRVQ